MASIRKWVNLVLIGPMGLALPTLLFWRRYANKERAVVLRKRCRKVVLDNSVEMDIPCELTREIAISVRSIWDIPRFSTYVGIV